MTVRSDQRSMKANKLLYFLLAAVLCLSLVTFAYASETDPDNVSVWEGEINNENIDASISPDYSASSEASVCQRISPDAGSYCTPAAVNEESDAGVAAEAENNIGANGEETIDTTGGAHSGYEDEECSLCEINGDHVLNDETTSSFTAKSIYTENLGSFRYWLYTPSDPTDGMPLIVYLHGGSGKGDDLGLVTSADGFPKYLQDGILGDIPAYVIIPQLPSSKKGWTDVGTDLMRLIRNVCTAYNISSSHISLTGHSMGGTGTWGIAAAYPASFWKIAPCSGSINNTTININNLKGIPVRSFVGSADTIVSPDSSINFVTALKQAGGDAEVTVFEGAGHFDVPALVYLDESIAIIDWLISEPGTHPDDSLPCGGGDSCPGRIFTDMPLKGSWAHDPIDWAVVQGITAGTSATTFSPNAGCTRAQVVTFLWRAAGMPEPTTTNNPFKDVMTDAYYYKAVLWAFANGVTAGTSADTFSPNSTCTRAQIVTFLWRYEGSPEPLTFYNSFSDVKSGSYYEKSVLWASEASVTAGTSADTFSPDATCTRAQVVTFLYRDIN